MLRGFKRITLLFVIIIFSFLSFVIAKSTRIDNVLLKDKSTTIDVTEPIVITDNNEITSKIEFNKLDDYAVFELLVKNTEEDKYRISKIQDNNTFENLEILYQYDKNYIEPNESTKVNITMEYVKPLENSNKININNLEINIELTKETASNVVNNSVNNVVNNNVNNVINNSVNNAVNNNVNNVVYNLEKNDKEQSEETKRTYIINNIYEVENPDGTSRIVTVTGKDSTTPSSTTVYSSSSPRTGDTIIIYVIVLIVASFVAAVLFKKSKRNLLMLILIIPLLGVPLLTNAEDKIPLKIVFNNIVINAQDETKIATYTVKHRYIKIDDTVEEETEELEGIIGSTVTPDLRSRDGFNNPERQSIIIKADGTSTVTYVYTERDRNRFVSYNQELHVEGMNLYNKYGELVVLEGMAIGNSRNLREDNYNRESISTLKNEWHNNVLRIPMDIVDAGTYRKGYVNHPELIERVYDIVDICTDLDMYAIVDWHVLSGKDKSLNDGDPLKYLDYAKDFFTKVATRYKDQPNVIYEICNEPLSNEMPTWEAVTQYANEIIPLIRALDEDALILVAAPSLTEYDFSEAKLQYDNIMYVVHIYPGHLSGSGVNTIVQIIEQEVPVFITEFGTTTDLNNDLEYPTEGIVFVEDFSDRLMHYFKKFNISWTNYCMSANYGLPLVQDGKWNNNLNDDILNPSGKYIKKVFLGEKTFEQFDEIAEMMPPKQRVAYWQPEYLPNITKATFENHIDVQKVNNAIISWDITSIASGKKVVAYLESDPNDNTKYYLFIAGEGEVRAFFSIDELFKDCTNLKEIDFTHLDTTAVTSMRQIFNNCHSLERVILGDKFDTSSTIDTYFMFKDCWSLTENGIDISKFNFQMASHIRGMFQRANGFQHLDLSNLNNKRVNTIGIMFDGCARLKILDISSFNFRNHIDYGDAFTRIRDGNTFTIIVRGEEEKAYLEAILTNNNVTNAIVVTKDYVPVESFAEAFANGEYDWSDLHKVAKIISGRFGLGENDVNKNTLYVDFTYNEKKYRIEVGDIFEVKDNENVSYKVRILGFNTDRLADDSNLNGEFTYEG